MKLLTAIWAVVVAACIAAQPFVMGFYSDDWPDCATAARIGLPFSKALFRFVSTINPSRIGYMPLRYLFSSLFRDRPFLWQSAVLVGNCVVALILVSLIGLLIGKESVGKNPAAIWIGLCWLLLPWNDAMLVWPTLLPNIVSMALLGWLCAWLVRGWSQHRSHALAAGLIYLWMCLGYEAFYFQWITIALIGLALWRAGRARLQEVGYSAGALVVAQMFAAMWYFVAPRAAIAGLTTLEHPIQSAWPRILMGDLLTTIPSIYRSLGAVKIPFAVAAVLIMAIWCAYCYRALRSGEPIESTRTNLILAACCLIGGVLSILAFALGGRGIQATGMDTRTLEVFNFWLVVAVGICVSGLVEQVRGRMRMTVLVLLGCSGAALAAGHVLRLVDWATAWKLQKEILAEAPLTELRATPPHATILLVNRLSVNRATIFAAPWDLNAAMPWKYPFLEGRIFRVYNAKGGTLSWDGQKLVYQRGGESETASDLYIWRPAQRVFEKAREPFRVRPSLQVEPF